MRNRIKITNEKTLSGKEDYKSLTTALSYKKKND